MSETRVLPESHLVNSTLANRARDRSDHPWHGRFVGDMDMDIVEDNFERISMERASQSRPSPSLTSIREEAGCADCQEWAVRLTRNRGNFNGTIAP